MTGAMTHILRASLKARVKGVDLDIRTVSTPEEIAPAIDPAKASGAAGLNVLASPLFFVPNQRVIFERTAALGLPAMYQWPEQAHGGRPCRVRPEPHPDLSSAVLATARRALAWDQARRLAGRTADDIRAGHQSQHREGA